MICYPNFNGRLGAIQISDVRPCFFSLNIIDIRSDKIMNVLLNVTGIRREYFVLYFPLSQDSFLSEHPQYLNPFLYAIQRELSVETHFNPFNVMEYIFSVIRCISALHE